MRLISRQTVYFDRRHHAAFPSTAALPDGSVLLTFRRAPDPRHLLGGFHDPSDGDGDGVGADFNQVDHLDPRSHIAALRLDDRLAPQGDAWSLPCDVEAADQDPSLLRLSSGRVLQTGFTWRPVAPWIVPRLKAAGVGVAGSPSHHGVGFIFWGAYARWSDDGGRSWSDRRPLPIVPGQPDQVPGERPYFGGPVRGRAVELADGTVLQASYALRPSDGGGAALLHASADGGESWAFRGRIVEDPGGAASFLEPALVQAANGKLFVFCRTGGLNGRIAVASSHDLGATWRPWRSLAAVGCPCDALPLPDGRVLVVYGRRHPPFGVRGRIWDADAERFVKGKEIVLCDDAPSPDVGYPWAVARADGDIVVFYYVAARNGLRGIAAATLRPQPVRF